MSNLDKAVAYLKNVGGSIEREKFMEDFEPVGEMLLIDLYKANLAWQRDGKINLYAGSLSQP